MSIIENYQKIRKEIPESVTIVLAIKRRTPEEVIEAINAGATDLGENYVQEAEQMISQLGNLAQTVNWHMIGDLQSNKINKTLKFANMIQTVNSYAKAEAIDKRAENVGVKIPVLIEINSGRETRKAGIEPDEKLIEKTVRNIAGLKNISLEGLMTMGPVVNNPEELRPFFRKTRQLFEHIESMNIPNIKMKTLSMGMSNSYQIAIEEGSTMIRLGSVIFGPRIY